MSRAKRSWRSTGLWAGAHSPRLYNLPGQSELRFQLGTTRTFRNEMLRRLAEATFRDGPRNDHILRPFADLDTNPATNWAVALIEAWAGIGTVLSFYQERIINENFLDTAEQAESVDYLLTSLGATRQPNADIHPVSGRKRGTVPPGARTSPRGRGQTIPTSPGSSNPLHQQGGSGTGPNSDPLSPGNSGQSGAGGASRNGRTGTGSSSSQSAPSNQGTSPSAPQPGYAINPGVAAETYLAFTMSTSKGAPSSAELSAGFPVINHPSSSKAPQTFETSAALTARADWNAMAANIKTVQTNQVLDAEATGLLLSGTQTGFATGSQLLVIGTDSQGDTQFCFGQIAEADVNKTLKQTLITWTTPLAQQTDLAGTLTDLQVYLLQKNAGLFGQTAPAFADQPSSVKLRYTDDIQGGVSLWTSAQDKGPNLASSMNAGLPDLNVTALLYDTGGNAYLGTEKGVYLRRWQSDSWVTMNSGLLPKSVYTLCMDSQSQLYAGGNGGAVYRSQGPGKPWVSLAGSAAQILHPRFSDGTTPQGSGNNGTNTESASKKYVLEKTALPSSVVRRIYPLKIIEQGAQASSVNAVAALTGFGLFLNRLDGNGWVSINDPRQDQTTLSNGYSSLPITDALVFGPSQIALIAFGSTLRWYHWTATLPLYFVFFDEVISILTEANTTLEKQISDLKSAGDKVEHADATSVLGKIIDDVSDFLANPLDSSVIGSVADSVLDLLVPGLVQKIQDIALDPLKDLKAQHESAVDDLNNDIESLDDTADKVQAAVTNALGKMTTFTSSLTGKPDVASAASAAAPAPPSPLSGAAPQEISGPSGVTLTQLQHIPKSDQSRALILVGSSAGVYQLNGTAIDPLPSPADLPSSAVRDLQACPPNGPYLAVASFDSGVYGLQTDDHGETFTWANLADIRPGPIPPTTPTVPLLASPGTTPEGDATVLFSSPLIYPDEWPDFEIQGHSVDISDTNTQIADGSWILLDGAQPEKTCVPSLYQSSAAKKTSRSDYGLKASVTDVTLGYSLTPAVNLQDYDLRRTQSWFNSKVQTLVVQSEAKNTPVEGKKLVLEGLQPDLKAGQAIAVSGQAPRGRVITAGGLSFAGSVRSRSPDDPTHLVNMDVKAIAQQKQHILVAAGVDGLYSTLDGGRSFWRDTCGALADLKAPDLSEVLIAKDGRAFARSGSTILTRKQTSKSQKIQSLSGIAFDAQGALFALTSEGALGTIKEETQKGAQQTEIVIQPPQRDGRTAMRFLAIGGGSVACATSEGEVFSAQADQKHVPGSGSASEVKSVTSTWDPRPALQLSAGDKLKCIVLDATGSLFAASRESLWSLKNGTWIAETNCPAGRICSFAISASGEYALATKTRFWTSHDRGQNWQPFPLPSTVSPVAMLTAQGKDIFALTKDLSVYAWSEQGAAWRQISLAIYPDRSPTSVSAQLAVAPKGDLQILESVTAKAATNSEDESKTESTLWYIAPSHWTTVPYKDEFGASLVEEYGTPTALGLYDVALGAEGNETLIVGTDSGTVLTTSNLGGHWQHAPQAGGNDKSITVIHVNAEGSCYLGTDGNGVFELELYANDARSLPSAGLANKSILALATLPGQRMLLAGTRGRGLFGHELSETRWTSFGPLMTRSVVTSILPLSTREWVIGTLGFGVMRSLDGGGTWVADAPGCSNAISALSADESLTRASKFWIGARSRVILVNPDSTSFATLTLQSKLVLPARLSRDLDQGFITDTLRSAFKTAHVSLPEDSQLSQISTGRQWVLSDSSGTVFVLERNGAEISVSEPTDSLRLLRDSTSASERNRGHASVSGPESGFHGVQDVAVEDRHHWTVSTDAGFDGHFTSTKNQVFLQPSKEDDPQLSAVSIVASAKLDQDAGATVLALESPLATLYDRSSTRVNANLTQATQGKSVPNEVQGYQGHGAHGEILGDGDFKTPNQSFKLRQSPLTYLAAPPPVFRQSTLTVYVNDEVWAETRNLKDCGPSDKVYQLTTTSQGSWVTFGDGAHGQRLPSGSRNVVANYRVGLGPSGDVSAGSLTILQQHVQGLSKVTNPVAAKDGQPPEPAPIARSKARKNLRTVAGLRTETDYKGFASTYPGIIKADAAFISDAPKRTLALTLVAQLRLPQDPGTFDQTVFLEQMRQVQVLPRPRVAICWADVRQFSLSLSVWADDPAGVREQVATALRTNFDQAHRKIGQGVTTSEILSTVQALPGVLGASVTELYFSDASKALNDALSPAPARVDPSTGEILAAQILGIHQMVDVNVVPVPQRSGGR